MDSSDDKFRRLRAAMERIQAELVRLLATDRLPGIVKAELRRLHLDCQLVLGELESLKPKPDILDLAKSLIQRVAKFLFDF